MVASGSAAIRYVDAIFRSHALMLTIGGAVFLGSLCYALLGTPEYAATMRISVRTLRPFVAGTTSPQRVASGGELQETQVNSEALLLESTDLLEGLVRYRDETLLKQQAPDDGSAEMARQVADIERRLEVTVISNTNLIEGSFRDEDAMSAKLSLKWLSTAFIEKEKRVEGAVDDEMGRREIVDIRVAQEPTLSPRSVLPGRMVTLLMGAVAACFISLCCVWLKDAMRETAFTPAELEAMLAVPVLATVPEHRQPPRIPSVAPRFARLIQLRRVSGFAERESGFGQVERTGENYAQP